MMYAIGDHVQYKNIHGIVRFICDESLSILVNDPKHKALECRVVVPHCEWHLVQVYGEK